MNHKLDSVLNKVLRPGRYVGNEVNIIRKNWDEIPVRIALAFPDIYEIGMSNQGLSILYHILNKTSWILAERVYSPWTDMEALMRERDIPLYALESFRDIKSFDVLGITYQYELQLTNLLNLIDLSKIPLKTVDRGIEDPLIVIGGPCVYNPEPLADFVDAVVLGDGEDIVLRIAEVIKEGKETNWNRIEKLEALSQLEGVYIPQFYKPVFQENQFKNIEKINPKAPDEIVANTIDSLDLANYPEKPLVPLIEVTHDRLSLEVMRGCTRGCRFCNAGMIYRPVRERSVDDLMAQTRNAIQYCGFDEISLVSLSTSDYSCLLPLLHRLKDFSVPQNISLSLPSLRADTFTETMADFAKSVIRKSGLTFAPEAGTQRLRDVINKNNTEEDLLNALRIAFERGWLRVKLYFMIGLPTETNEDLDGIVTLLGKVVQLSKKYGNREIQVSISPFSPKPHTPFQWAEQVSRESINEKVQYIRNHVPWRQVKIAWREPEISFLEAIFGIGDRRLGAVIQKAWEKGARFDGWSDQLNYQLWVDAFSECDLDMHEFTQLRQTDQPLPWDHLSKGVTKEYMRCEYEKAIAGSKTQDCRTHGCSGCGMNKLTSCQEQIEKIKQDVSTESGVSYGRKVKRKQDVIVNEKFRFVYSKSDPARFASHLDTMNLFIRSFKRAGIKLAYSQGHHPHPKVSSGPPLSLGHTSLAEYMDFELDSTPVYKLTEQLNAHLPDGFEIFKILPVIQKVKSLNSAITQIQYEIGPLDPANKKEVEEKIAQFLQTTECHVMRRKKEVNIRSFVEKLVLNESRLQLCLKVTPGGTARVDEIINQILPGNNRGYRVCRVAQYIDVDGVLKTPLEVL